MNNFAQPSASELNALIHLYKKNLFTELETQSQLFTVQYPNAGIIWKLLGASQSMQGKNAELAFQRAALLLPKDPEPCNNLGNIFVERGQFERAMECYNNALKIKPDFAEAHYNLGNTLIDLGRIEDAIASYQRALKYQPDNALFYSNLGTALQDMSRYSEAELSYRKAIRINQNLSETHNNLGVVLSAQGKFEAAVESFCNAISLNHGYADAYGNMANALKCQGKLDESIACYQQQVQLAPENGFARHMLASLTGNNTERAPAQYVEKVFDGYAEQFDAHLVQALQYNVPSKLVELVAQHSSLLSEKWRILDLGCGTGLVGLAFAPFLQQLVGVDLSPKMLKRAQGRGLYNRLECSDLLDMMRNEHTSSYDLIIAADVFVYLGKLDEIIRDAKRLISPNGMLAFSIEAIYPFSGNTPNQTIRQLYRLENSGRYAHSYGYIQNLASANDFQIQSMIETQIRMEAGIPINGYLILLRA
jgi:predicted TPR repeat methyltransferase